MVLPVTDHGTNPEERMVAPNVGRLRLPLGEGVDRDVGIFMANRGVTRDLRNLLLRGGTAHLRRGMVMTASGFTVPDGPTMTDIIGIEFLPVANLAVVVGFDSVSREVHVFTVRGDGEDEAPAYVGQWFTAPGDDVPVVTMTETYHKVFMAHAYHGRNILARAPTYVYDPYRGLEDAAVFAPLRADWVTGDGLIRFAGVQSYLNYLLGWGFGNAGIARPERVRISLPGQPILPDGLAGFDESHWVDAGARGAPVIACAPAGNGLHILKASETYPLFGSSPQNFGVGPAVDQNFGCIGPNLWTNVNGLLFVWSHEGPRMSNGGPLQDLALPLDLDGPSPSELQEVAESGFSCYVPDTRVVLFAFGRWVFALDLRGGQPGGWSYWELGEPVLSADILHSGAISALVEPEAGPAFVGVEGEPEEDSFQIRIGHSPGITGSEIVESFYRALGDDEWQVGPTSLVEMDEANEQVVTFEGLNPATLYDLAFRYSLDGMRHPAYIGDDPDGWGPEAAISLGQAQTADRDVPDQEGVSAEWRRLSGSSENLTLTWESPVVGQLAVLEHSMDGQTWTEVTDTAQQPYTFPIPEGDGEKYHYFRVSYPGSGQPMRTGRFWAGPPAPRDPLDFIQGRPPVLANVREGAGTYLKAADVRFGWALVPTPSWATKQIVEIRHMSKVNDDYDGRYGSAQFGYYENLERRFAAIWVDRPAQAGERSWPFGPNLATISRIAMRTRLTSHGVEDFSDWGDEASLRMNYSTGDHEFEAIELHDLVVADSSIGTDCEASPATVQLTTEIFAPKQYLLTLERWIDGVFHDFVFEDREKSEEDFFNWLDEIPYRLIDPAPDPLEPSISVHYVLRVIEPGLGERESKQTAPVVFAGVEACP